MEQPATRPTTAGTRPALKSVELHYGIYLARFDVSTTVTPDGLLRSVRTSNKSYGPNDLDPKFQRVEIREGRLTPQQVADLARLFAGWDALSAKPYGGVPDGGDVTIRYGDKTVSGGSEVPGQVSSVRARLDELTATMPVVKP